MCLKNYPKISRSNIRDHIFVFSCATSLHRKTGALSSRVMKVIYSELPEQRADRCKGSQLAWDGMHDAEASV